MTDELFLAGLVSGVGGVATGATTGAIGAAAATSIAALLVGLGFSLVCVSLFRDIQSLRSPQVIADD